MPATARSAAPRSLARRAVTRTPARPNAAWARAAEAFWAVGGPGGGFDPPARASQARAVNLSGNSSPSVARPLGEGREALGQVGQKGGRLAPRHRSGRIGGAGGAGPLVLGDQVVAQADHHVRRVTAVPVAAMDGGSIHEAVRRPTPVKFGPLHEGGDTVLRLEVGVGVPAGRAAVSVLRLTISPAWATVVRLRVRPSARPPAPAEHAGNASGTTRLRCAWRSAGLHRARAHSRAL